MTLEQLIQQYRLNTKRVSPQGYANSSAEIPPFLRILCKYFNLKQFSNMEEFLVALSEAVKNPNMFNTLKSNLFSTSLDPHLQLVLSRLLMSYFNNTAEGYLPAFNNVLTTSLIVGGNQQDNPISFGTLGSIESTDVSKRIASTKGLEFLSPVLADVSHSIDNDIINMLALLVLGAQTTTNGDAVLQRSLSTLFKMLMCTDGYSDITNILKIMKDKAAMVAENIEEISKTSGISFDMGSINDNKKKLLSMSTMGEQFQIVDQLCQSSVAELAQVLQLDQQRISVLYTTIIELIKNSLPSILIEDLPATLKFDSVKTNSGEARKLHLNSLFIAQTMVSMGIPSYTSFLLGYIITCASYKNNPSILENTSDVSLLTAQILNVFGLGQIGSRITQGMISVGDVSLKNCLKYDIIRKTNTLTLMYASINNDINLQSFASTVMARPEFTVYNICNEIAKRYPGSVKGRRYSTLSVELMDNLLSLGGLSNFTTSANPKLKDVVSSFTDMVTSVMKDLESTGAI